MQTNFRNAILLMSLAVVNADVGLLAQSALLDCLTCYMPRWASSATFAVVSTIPYFDVVPGPCVLRLIKQPLTAVTAQNTTLPLSCGLSATEEAESPQYSGPACQT